MTFKRLSQNCRLKDRCQFVPAGFIRMIWVRQLIIKTQTARSRGPALATTARSPSQGLSSDRERGKGEREGGGREKDRGHALGEYAPLSLSFESPTKHPLPRGLSVVRIDNVNPSIPISPISLHRSQLSARDCRTLNCAKISRQRYITPTSIVADFSA